MPSSLTLAPGESASFHKQIVEVLSSLPKTLLVEESRGATDVLVYKKAAPATVLVVTDQGLGSGVLVSSTGDVVTNYHVVRNAKQVAVVFKPERGIQIRKELARLAIPTKIDEVADLALLRVQNPPPNLPYLSLGTTMTLEVGDDVHAIGHPEGEVWTYTTGTISQIRPKYDWTGDDKITHRATVIQTQTAINPGNSGGPLLNNQAEVIGINSFRMEGEGLNYAIAADTVGTFLKRPTSRIAKPAAPNAATSRVEQFGEHILGEYTDSRTPPPDLWAVFTGASGDSPDYAVMGSSGKTKLDTLFKGTDPKWNGVVYYFDTDCDGVIDLVGYKDPGSTTIDKYQRPESPIRLDSLGNELANAFSSGVIPYRQVQFYR
jgi:S1-C subfamily serine protease